MDVDPGTAGELFDPSLLRRAYGAFATGVTVVTVGGPAPHAMTANSFTAVSLDPPLVLVCVRRDAVMHRALQEAGRFGVSVLSAQQEYVARYFADRRRPLGESQFQVAQWVPGERTGSPLLVNAAAHFECDVWRAYDGGDHTIFLGRLLALHRSAADDALLFLRGELRQLSPQSSEVTT